MFIALANNATKLRNIESLQSFCWELKTSLFRRRLTKFLPKIADIHFNNCQVVSHRCYHSALLTTLAPATFAL